MMMVAQSAAAAASAIVRSPAERPAAPSDPGVGVGAAVALSSRFFVKTASKTAAFSPPSAIHFPSPSHLDRRLRTGYHQ